MPGAANQLIFRMKGGILGCASCILDSDSGPGCAGKKCVEEYRFIDPCGCMCRDMAFRACPKLLPVDQCICVSGPPQAGAIIVGANIGWFNPSFGKTLIQIARRVCPENPHTYWTLWGSNDATDVECPISTDGWDQLPMDGELLRMDLGELPILDLPDSPCISGAFSLSNGDLLIDGPDDGGGGGDPPAPGDEQLCTQTGGRDWFMLKVEVRPNGVVDDKVKILVLCPFKGIRPPPQCEKPPCCNLSNFSFSIIPCAYTVVDTDGNPIGDGAPEGHAIFTFPDPDCTCLPISTTLTVEGNDYDVGPGDTIDVTIHGCVVGGTLPVTYRLQQFYSDACKEASDCVDLDESSTITL